MGGMNRFYVGGIVAALIVGVAASADADIVIDDFEGGTQSFVLTPWDDTSGSLENSVGDADAQREGQFSYEGDRSFAAVLIDNNGRLSAGSFHGSLNIDLTYTFDDGLNLSDSSDQNLNFDFSSPPTDGFASFDVTLGTDAASHTINFASRVTEDGSTHSASLADFADAGITLSDITSLQAYISIPASPPDPDSFELDNIQVAGSTNDNPPDVVAAPEPGSAAMLIGLGIAGLAYRRR